MRERDLVEVLEELEARSNGVKALLEEPRERKAQTRVTVEPAADAAADCSSCQAQSAWSV